MQSDLLKMEQVSRFFKVQRGIFSPSKKLVAVDNVSFSICKGESLGLVGESGCGKSTIGKLACGLVPPSEGKILFQDSALPSAGPKSWAAAKIQVIFQDPVSSLDPRMSVIASVAEPLRKQGLKKAERFQKAEDLLAEMGLKNLRSKYPHQFSGGQRQRMAIGRALITHPDLIICDEPVSALDASVQSQILNLLKDVQADYGLSYLFISHDLSVVGFMCARIMVMYLGQIVEEGTREEIFSRAAHPYTRALLAANPAGERNWANGKDVARLPPPLRGELPSPLNPPDGCRFNPRCPEVMEICTKKMPPWVEIASGWRARCFRAEPLQ